MLAFHNTLYHKSSGFELDTSPARSNSNMVNLGDFNGMLNLINNGQSRQVAQKIVTEVNRLIPELEQKRLAAEISSRSGGYTQGNFTLSNGFEMSFIVSDNGARVSYSPKESSTSVDSRMPFGYITLGNGEVSSIDM